MSKHLPEFQMVALALGDQALASDAPARKHLGHCPGCAQALAQLQQAVYELRRDVVEKAPSPVWTRLHSRVVASRSDPDVPADSWWPLLAGQAAGVLLLFGLFLLLGHWLDGALLQESLSAPGWIRYPVTGRLALLLISGMGLLSALALAPVFWWEAMDPFPSPRDLNNRNH